MGNKCKEIEELESDNGDIRRGAFDDAGPSDHIRELNWEPKHKIFLSHSGVQKDFTEQLCKDLERVHHFPFFDKRLDSLPKGEMFPALIIEAAKQCQVAVLVLSEEFFTRSKWPMIELSTFVQAQETANRNLKILPLFLGLRMSQLNDASVRENWLTVWQSWAEEDDRIDVKQWVHALSRILGGINAMEYIEGEGHVTFREKVVAAVCKLIPPDVKWDVSHVRSMGRLCEPILQKVKEVEVPHKTYGVRVVGLYGMGGVGKTTISKALCNEMFGHFAGKVCHVELGADKNLVEVRKNVLRELTEANEELLSDESKLGALLKSRMCKQRVFLCVDNIWENQIEEAQMYLGVGYHEGSIVLATSRSRGILVDWLHFREGDCLEMPELMEEDATTLFLDHATPCEPLKDSDWDIIRRCVQKCHFLKTGIIRTKESNSYHYLPLALKVLGSQLRSISDDPSKWEASLSKLKVDMFNLMRDKKHPVHSILRLGYDALCEDEQHIFSDLALLVIPHWRYSKRYDRYSVLEWLSMIYGKPKDDIKNSLKVLWRKALLDDVRDLDQLEVRIHDLYLDFAKEEARAGPVEGKRFLIHEGGSDVPPELLKKQLGSLERVSISNSHVQSLKKANLHLCSNVKVLQLFDCDMLEEIDLQGMESLISVEVINCDRFGAQLAKTRFQKLRLFKAYNYTFLQKDNRYRYPAPFLHHLSSLTALQVLCLQGSSLRSQTVFPPELSGCINLRTLALVDLDWLEVFPDVSSLINLKTIHFADCSNATGNSVWSRSYSFWWKTGLSKCCFVSRTSLFDSMILLTNLQDLNLRLCRDIDDFSGLCELVSLHKLSVSYTFISEVPDLRKLKHLQFLDVSDCFVLGSLGGIAHSTSLQYLNVQWCPEVLELPEQLSSFEKLERVELGFSGIRTLPNGYKVLAGLGILKVGGCCNLIEFLVEELQGRVFEGGLRDCVSTGCVSSYEQSRWERRKDNIAFDLLKDVVSPCYCWEYMLNDEEKYEVAVRALCEHNDRGTLSSVLEEFRLSDTVLLIWVVVATAPRTFEVVTEKLAMREPSWQYSMLHYTMRTLPNLVDSFRTWTLWSMKRWRVEGILAVLKKCREQLVDESNGLEVVLIAEGTEVVDTLLGEIEAVNGKDKVEGSILYCTGPEGCSYSECFPNFPFGPALAKQTFH